MSVKECVSEGNSATLRLSPYGTEDAWGGRRHVSSTLIPVNISVSGESPQGDFRQWEAETKQCSNLVIYYDLILLGCIKKVFTMKNIKHTNNMLNRDFGLI